MGTLTSRILNNSSSLERWSPRFTGSRTLTTQVGPDNFDCMSSRDAEILISDGGFFVFGDVSVKIEGEYRLRFSLFEMVRERQEVMYIKSVMSEPFTGQPKVWSVVHECMLRKTLQSIHLEAFRA